MPRFRISLALMMLLVLASGATSALYVQILRHLPVAGRSAVTHPYHLAAVFVLAIVLTAPGLGAWRGHPARLALVQGTLACLGFLSWIGLMEWHAERLATYWFQGIFAGFVFVPLLIRRRLQAAPDREGGHRGAIQVCEAVAFAFLTMMLVLVGVLIQILVFEIHENTLSFP